jgi:hypothetical protein
MEERPNSEVIKRVLPKEESIAFLQRLSALKALSYEVKENKLTLLAHLSENESVLFKRPLLFPAYQENLHLPNYLEKLDKSSFRHLILLMQAGSAALAYYDNTHLVNHKVIRKYMVRKSQGKAQLKHLKTKGKSRLGSRIRLQQTEQYFEEINEKLQEWNVLPLCETLIYQCDITLWSMFYDESRNPVADKRDSRWIKVPLDLETPNLSVLQYVHKFAFKSYVEIPASLQAHFLLN